MPTEREVEPPLSTPKAPPPVRVRTVRKDGPKPWAPGESPVSKRNLIIAGEKRCRLPRCRLASPVRVRAARLRTPRVSFSGDRPRRPAGIASIVAFAIITPATMNTLTPGRELLRPILGAAGQASGSAWHAISHSCLLTAARLERRPAQLRDPAEQGRVHPIRRSREWRYGWQRRGSLATQLPGGAGNACVTFLSKASRLSSALRSHG